MKQPLGPGAVLLRGFARQDEAALLADLQDVIARAPLRHMVTPGGYRMSVAMTNCGALGWLTDRTGYRYDSIDPQSGKRRRHVTVDRIGGAVDVGHDVVVDMVNFTNNEGDVVSLPVAIDVDDANGRPGVRLDDGRVYVEEVE